MGGGVEGSWEGGVVGGEITAPERFNPSESLVLSWSNAVYGSTTSCASLSAALDA